MIGLKSGMIRPNHAKKWHDWSKKAPAEMLTTRNRVFVEKKAPAATLRTRIRVFFKKKAPAATLTKQKTCFFIKKAPAATFTTQKMHCYTDIGARCQYF
jgi:hypothetical protein